MRIDMCVGSSRLHEASFRSHSSNELEYAVCGVRQNASAVSDKTTADTLSIPEKCGSTPTCASQCERYLAISCNTQARCSKNEMLVYGRRIENRIRHVATLLN